MDGPGMTKRNDGLEFTGVPSVFDDAVALWHMGGLRDGAGEVSLVPYGDVRVGVELAGVERRASIVRGGDGFAAELADGYLEVDRTLGAGTVLTGQAMTLCVRVRVPSGQWDGALVAKHGGPEALSYSLFAADGVLAFDLGVDAPAREGVTGYCETNGLFRVTVPVEMIGTTDWHDVVVRFAGAKLDMFVDGVLVDEEWPMGSLRQTAAACRIGAVAGDDGPRFRGLIDHVALWRRALSEGEIVALSGGSEHVRCREVEMLGPERPVAQYWRPRGHNVRAGDCMCTFDGERFHLFWLFDRRQHGSKWGLGAHQYAHASTRDLVRWDHHPMAVPITEQWEGSMCTGNVLVHENKYHACYYVRPTGRPGHHPGGFCMASSTDGVHFVKKMDPDPSLGHGDPMAFRDESTGRFHLLMPGPAVDGRRSRTHFVSADLKHWEEQAEPYIVTLKESTSLECPDLFEWNGWWYFIMGRDGLWRSRSCLGPWEAIREDIYDGLVVPKVAAFTGNRRIMAGWLSDGGWAGNLVFRELVQHEDGTLGVKFLDEMMPPAVEPMGEMRTVDIAASSASAPPAIGVMPGDGYLSMHVRPSPGARDFGLVLRTSDDGGRGLRLLFDPSAHSVRFDPPADCEQPDGFRELHNVDGLDRPFELTVVLAGDIVDVCIDRRRCLIGRFRSFQAK